MIFSACRINRECREKIPTKINNKQDIVTCWDFCRSLVWLVLNTTHTSVPTIRNMGISIIMNMYLEQIPRDMYKVKILKGFKHLMMNKYCYIWSLMEYEMYIQWRMGQCLMYETVLFIFDLSLAWFDYRGLLYKKWKNDGFSMPLKLFVQVPTDNCCPFSPFLSAMINNYLKKRPFWIATCMCENVWWLNYSPI